MAEPVFCYRASMRRFFGLIGRYLYGARVPGCLCGDGLISRADPPQDQRKPFLDENSTSVSFSTGYSAPSTGSLPCSSTAVRKARASPCPQPWVQAREMFR